MLIMLKHAELPYGNFLCPRNSINGLDGNPIHLSLALNLADMVLAWLIHVPSSTPLTLNRFEIMDTPWTYHWWYVCIFSVVYNAYISTWCWYILPYDSHWSFWQIIQPSISWSLSSVMYWWSISTHNFFSLSIHTAFFLLL